jgi:hypothetical protein
MADVSAEVAQFSVMFGFLWLQFSDSIHYFMS